MIILTNAQGDVLNAIPDKVYQGSNLANQIVIVSPWSANLQVTIAYKLPNGDFTEPKLMTAFATNPLPENLQANAWSIDIDEPVTENFGLVEFQFKAYNGTQKIATGGCSFTVQHGVAPILPATPSQTIYEQILEAISVLSSTIVAGDFESKALTPYDSTFEYSKYDVIADFQTYGGMYYSLTDNNKGNLPTDTTKWAILPYATLTQLSASIQAHNTSQTAHTDIRTEIANIVNGNTTIEKYQTKDNLVDTWATTPTDSTYPSAKLVKTTIDKIKSDKGLINFVFATKQDFLGWIDGTIETDINGRTTSELQIGSNILIQEENVTDYWCSSISDPLTINDFTPLETELNLSNYLAKDNTSEYNPTGDYNPATKKYADDSGFNNISSLNLSHGEETVTYDTTDGITVNGNARKTNTDSSTKDFNVEFNVPIVAGDGINIDATSDNKKVEIKYVPSSVQISGESGTLTQAQIGILSKPNAILGRTIDADHFVVYVNQGIIEKNNINYLHYVSIPYIGTQLSETLNFEAIDINVNDAPNDNLGKWELITEMLPNLTTLLSYIDMSPATVEISGSGGTLTEEQMQALTWGELSPSPLVEKSRRNGTILLVNSGDNPILPSKKFYYFGSEKEYNYATSQYINKAVYASYEGAYTSSIRLSSIKITVDAGADYGKWILTSNINWSVTDIDKLNLYDTIRQVSYNENGLSMTTYGSISSGYTENSGGKTNYFKLPLVPADDSITITADEQNKKFTIKSNGGGKDNLLVVYNDDKTAVYCKRILSVPDIQANTKFDLVFGTTPIQGTLDITVIGKLSSSNNVGSITRHIGVDYQGETTSTIVYKDHNYTQVDKSIAQYIFIGDNLEPLTVDSRGLSIAIENNVKGGALAQSLQNVQVIVEYTSLKTENLDVNWLLNITAGESSAGTISAWDTRPSGYVGSVQSLNRIYGTNGGGAQTTFGINNGGLEYSSDIPRYYNGQIGVSEIPSPLNELQDDLYTTSSIYATVNGGYLQKCVTLKGATDPTPSTQAYYVGQLYLNTTDKTLFKCDSINGSTYTWTAVCGNGGTFDSTPTKNSTNPVTSNGIQQALVDNVGVSLQACTTYQQIVDLLNANHNIGYGNIGSSAETTGLRALLPSIPFDSNFGSVRARIISQGGAMGNNAGLWALEFVLTSDFDAGGETQKPVWHLYVRNSIVSDTDTLYVGEWG